MKALVIGGATIDVISSIDTADIECITMKNATNSYLMMEQGKKVEATRIGFDTETRTVKMKGSTREKIKFQLKKIPEGKRRAIEGASSDADKIINPGEVNIRPPGM